MNTKTNLLRYSAKLLLLLSVLFWGIPNSQATSYSESTSQREISASELLPVKPKAKAKKAKKIKKGHQKQVTDVGWYFAFGIAAVFGIALFCFGIGFNIFALWLSGLIIFGLFNLLNSTLIYDRDYYQSIVTAVTMFFIVLFNAAVFLAFLVWGLIALMPIVWITGLAALVFALAQFLAILILAD